MNFNKMPEMIKDWQQDFLALKVKKSYCGGISKKEYEREIKKGIVQAFNNDTAKLLPQKELWWKCLQIHTLSDVDLNVDDFVYYKEKKYIVIGKIKYLSSGYNEFHIKEV
ncbi:MAG: hypothetical protein BWY78_00235 [Alphaproteobacteria bacterium ADurb.Bin438]|nr:MAG: hypothetical protein BWY78_00235 [Alphaproteobacteria bacterium ADurb.Bin438]